MKQAEYNTKVQAVQDALPPGATRVSPIRDQDSRIVGARFEVHWGGQWRRLGEQRKPFRPDATYEWFEDEEIKTLASMADSLARS